jgi:uncharacterized membrane protein
MLLDMVSLMPIYTQTFFYIRMSIAPAVLFNLVTAIVSGCLSGLTGLLLYRMNRRLDSKPNDKVNSIQKRR